MAIFAEMAIMIFRYAEIAANTVNLNHTKLDGYLRVRVAMIIKKAGLDRPARPLLSTHGGPAVIVAGL
jgi:hypothetical protein